MTEIDHININIIFYMVISDFTNENSKNEDGIVINVIEGSTRELPDQNHPLEIQTG